MSNKMVFSRSGRFGKNHGIWGDVNASKGDEFLVKTDDDKIVAQKWIDAGVLIYENKMVEPVENKAVQGKRKYTKRK